MEKLEKYLDQVCRSIGGPIAMRDHVRQELREHLLDAVAQHQAAGMSEAEALEKALAEFGRPEEVRSELEETHGQRMLWIIDKALQWKEMTMRAKWLWTTWAYLALLSVIAMEVLFITFMVIFILPKFQRLQHDGMIDARIYTDLDLGWIPEFLDGVFKISDIAWVFALMALVAWVIFEWRVHSDNKPFMRFSALGTIAVGLMFVVVLTAGALVVSFCAGMPAIGRLVRPFAVQQIASVDTSVGDLEKALAQKDWNAMELHSIRMSQAFIKMTNAPPVIPSLAGGPDRPTLSDLRSHVSNVYFRLSELHQAIEAKDLARTEKSLQEFRKVYEPVREAVKRPMS